MIDRSESKMWNLKRRTAEDFCYALLGLMPRGFAWFTRRCGNWWKLFYGMSAGFVAVYDMFRCLVSNMSPVSTDDLDAWEKELGLPKYGFSFQDPLSRKREIIRVSRGECGNTESYFKRLANFYGLDINIYQYWKNPEKFEDVDFGNDDPNFYWMIKITTGDDGWFVCTCNDTCNDYLQYWWDSRVENIFDTIKPAHTKIVYSYNYEPCVYLVDDQRDYVIDDNGDRVVTY